MNRADLIKLLAASEREVLDDTARVEDQCLLVKELHRTGASKADKDKAFSGLILLDERLNLHTKDRDWYAEALKVHNE
jgi:hypothetical protein